MNTKHEYKHGEVGKMMVFSNANGFYVGRAYYGWWWSDSGLPGSRDSDYFTTAEEAEKCLDYLTDAELGGVDGKFHIWSPVPRFMSQV